MRFKFLIDVIGILLPVITGLAFSQITTSIKYIDKTFENEPFYYDLSYLNSNFSNSGSVQNIHSTRPRNGAPSESDSCDRIKRIPSFIRIDLKLSYFYQKYTESYGIPIIGSNKVTINGLKRACYVLKFYLAGNAKIREAFYKNNVRVVVLGASENILNIPEYHSLPPSWNFLRGLSPTRNIPLVTVSEENLLCSNDKFRSEDLMVHQLSYGLLTIEAMDSKLILDLKAAYQKAVEIVPWKNTFALVDIKEYLASAIDAYLGSYGKKDNFFFTLNDLKAYDSNIIEIIKIIFPCDNFYINKCKSSKEIELDQNIKLGNSCDSNKSITQSIYARQTLLAVRTQASLNYKNSRGLTLTEKIHVKTFPIVKTSISTILPTITSSYSTKNEETDCNDTNKNCEKWALKDECVRNRQYMNLECKKSCGLCGEQHTTRITRAKGSTKKINISVFENFCKDEYAHCPVLALRGDCKTNPFYMLQSCKRSCNLCGDLVNEKNRIHPTTKKNLIRRPVHSKSPSPSDYFTRTSTSINQVQGYLTNSMEVTTKQTINCQDLVNYCAELAERGDCETNKNSMSYYCAKTCRICYV